jgi:hypothetical protein
VVSPVTIDEGARENGLALMLAQLVLENVREHAWKKDDLVALEPLAVGIVAPDAGVRLTLVFERGLTLFDGLHPACDVLVTTDAERVAKLAHLPVGKLGPLRVPNYLGASGRRLVADLFRGRVRVKGLLRHPIKVARLLRLLSVS